MYVCVCVCVCVFMYVCMYVLKAGIDGCLIKCFPQSKTAAARCWLKVFFFLFSWWSKAINFVLMKGRTTVPVIEEVVACVQTSPISFVAIGKDRF